MKKTDLSKTDSDNETENQDLYSLTKAIENPYLLKSQLGLFYIWTNQEILTKITEHNAAWRIETCPRWFQNIPIREAVHRVSWTEPSLQLRFQKLYLQYSIHIDTNYGTKYSPEDLTNTNPAKRRPVPRKRRKEETSNFN